MMPDAGVKPLHGGGSDIVQRSVSTGPTPRCGIGLNRLIADNFCDF